MKRTRMRRMSAKRRRLLPQRKALLLGLGDLVGWRCEYPPCGWRGHLDGHEVKKPRARYWLNPEYMVMLCRDDHARAEAAYNAKEGRLLITGTRSAGWQFAEAPATNKFAVRSSLTDVGGAGLGSPLSKELANGIASRERTQFSARKTLDRVSRLA